MVEKPGTILPDKTPWETLKGCADFIGLKQLLNDYGVDNLTLQQIQTLGRRIQKMGGKDVLRIAFMGNFTLDLLPAGVTVRGATAGLQAKHYLGGFNQYYQEMLDSESGLRTFAADYIVLALSLRLLEPDLHYNYAGLDEKTREERKERALHHILDWVKLSLENTSATLLIANFALPIHLAAGIGDKKLPGDETTFYHDLNKKLAEALLNEDRCFILDIDNLAANFGRKKVCDPKLFFMAKMEWSEPFMGEVSRTVWKFIQSIQGLGKKCLVLDLDNTLWGGVVGEDGVLGVKVGQGDPTAEAFLEFQHCIKGLKARGILLALCSKNNLADVEEIFSLRTEMPLKWSDFSAVAVNWEPKHENIRRIASELNIGTDSMVFLDDNPAECSLVRQMLPEVLTVLLPEDPAAYVDVLSELDGLERAAILADDLRKSEQYGLQKQRTVHRASVTDMDAYLRSLETEVTIRSAAKEDLARVHQLFNKTNQFNLTTKRYSLGEVESFFTSEKHVLGTVSAGDRFGDLGLIGVFLLEWRENGGVLDSLLMSCRAMGRGIESAMMNHVKSLMEKNPGMRQLEAVYLPTPKNQPVENFLEGQGFKVTEARDDGSKHYLLAYTEIQAIDCAWIRLKN